MNRRRTACVLALLLATSFANAADIRFVEGDWLNDAKPGCTEQLTFTPDGIMRVVSGDERLEGTYVIEALAATESAVRVIRTITKTNNRRDCAGNRGDERGVTRMAYLLKDSATGMRLCLDVQGSRCLATLKRARTATSP